MTRLKQEDLFDVGVKMVDYDLGLETKTAFTLKQIACRASGIEENDFNKSAEDTLVAVIPISSGGGVIDGFAQSVRAVIRYLGAETFITEETDVSGIAESIVKGAQILFMADDKRFIAYNRQNGNVIDNAEATGRGYAAALDAMALGLSDKEVLVVGAGNVGKYALEYLKEISAKVAVFDIDHEKTKDLSEDIHIEFNFIAILPKYRYILEATPQKDVLTLERLHPETLIAAPGMPLGLTHDAYEVFKNKVIHDPLQIGVATMLAMAFL